METIDQAIYVNAYYFTNGRNPRSYPKQIEWGNSAYTFTDGMQYLVKKGKNVIKLFDMSDGSTIFRIKQEGNIWTLLSTR